jgi:hypothetical protein
MLDVIGVALLAWSVLSALTLPITAQKAQYPVATAICATIITGFFLASGIYLLGY